MNNDNPVPAGDTDSNSDGAPRAPSENQSSSKRDCFGDEIVRYVRIPIDWVTADAIGSLRDPVGSPHGPGIAGHSGTRGENDFLKWVLREAICSLADAVESIPFDPKRNYRVPYRPRFNLGQMHLLPRWIERRDSMVAVEKVIASVESKECP